MVLKLHCGKRRHTTEPLKTKLLVFCTFLSQEIETAYCESKAKCSKVSESKVGQGKHFRK